MKRSAAALCILAAMSGAEAQDEGEPGDFDFYVLSLSWSPTWCATSEDAARSRQCEEGADFGFIVHGLWPQYEAGYPEFCRSDAHPSRKEISSVLDLMPDRGLVAHTWRKHGSCSGLDPREYFEAIRAAFERVQIPREFVGLAADGSISAQAVERAFVGANPGLEFSGAAVACGDGWLAEVRLCLTRELDFRNCEEVDARGCRQGRLRLPAPH